MQDGAAEPVGEAGTLTALPPPCLPATGGGCPAGWSTRPLALRCGAAAPGVANALVKLHQARSVAPAGTVWKQRDRWTALGSAAGCVALGLSCRDQPEQHERRLFRALNHDTPERPVLRVPKQLGAKWVLPLLPLFGFLTSRPHLALTAAFAFPLTEGLEHGLKRLLERDRPARAAAKVTPHDDPPADGPSYPSGHAARAFTAVLLVAPYLPRSLISAGVVAAGVTSWVRVRQGAHFPADVLGGGLLGLTAASTLRAVFGRPATPYCRS